MSMWLSKKKKGDLVALCEQLNLRSDGLKKPELENLLATYLYEHQSTLWDDPTFSQYYETLAARSPHKLRASPKLINPIDPVIPEGTTRSRRRTSRYVGGSSDMIGSAEPEPFSTATATSTAAINGMPESDDASTEQKPIDSTVRTRTGSLTPQPPPSPRARRSNRITKAAIAEPTGSSSAVALPQTPAPNTIPLPPSPAQVATLIESRTNDLRTHISSYIHSHLTPTITTRIKFTQKILSNVISIAVLVHVFELVSLVRTLIPATYLVTIPPLTGGEQVPITLTSKSTTFKLPDLFILLEGGRFWIPVLTWALVSVIVPGLVGYFVNMTKGGAPAGRKQAHVGGYVCDPLTFALAKGLLGWAVWYRKVWQTEALGTVETAVGKEVLVLVGSGVVGVMGMWEGVMAR
ncbi:hypothetical protein BDZ91DRAFT_767235 [Kalaharituber pfeilii]|nr:hypothetical protein BDZ91DRAFT_767235 [Kalaharituber pfeilii]